MTAYLILRIAVTDEARWRTYRDAVVPLMERFGGRHATRPGRAELLEGEDDGRRFSAWEFPSMEAIRAFWHSPDYAPVKQLRRDAATLEAWAVPGT